MTDQPEDENVNTAVRVEPGQTWRGGDEEFVVWAVVRPGGTERLDEPPAAWPRAETFVRHAVRDMSETEGHSGYAVAYRSGPDLLHLTPLDWLVQGQGYELVTESTSAAKTGGLLDRSLAPESRADLRTELTRVLAQNGIGPDGQDGLHSWRCSEPDRYPDYCTCVPGLVDDLLAVLGPQEPSGEPAEGERG